MRDSVVRNRINLNKIIKKRKKKAIRDNSTVNHVDSHKFSPRSTVLVIEFLILRGFLLLLLTKDVTVDFVPTFICFNVLSFAQTNLDLLDLIDFFYRPEVLGDWFTLILMTRFVISALLTNVGLMNLSYNPL